MYLVSLHPPSCLSSPQTSYCLSVYLFRGPSVRPSHLLPAILLPFYSRRVLFQSSYLLSFLLPRFHPGLLRSVTPGSSRQHVTVGSFAMNFLMSRSCWSHEKPWKERWGRCQCSGTRVNFNHWLLDKFWDGICPVMGLWNLEKLWVFPLFVRLKIMNDTIEITCRQEIWLFLSNH